MGEDLLELPGVLHRGVRLTWRHSALNTTNLHALLLGSSNQPNDRIKTQYKNLIGQIENFQKQVNAKRINYVKYIEINFGR